MKKVIINADDLGADEARNAGILEAVQAGVVRSVSLLPNGEGIHQALRAIGNGGYEEVSIGAHLNLSEGKPISRNLRLLTGKNGTFQGKARTQQLLQDADNRGLEREVVQELDAQIRFLIAAGIPITHLDGHQHVHVFPAVRRTAIDAAKKYRIPWMRIPEEPFPSIRKERIRKESLSEASYFSRLGSETRSYLRAAGVRTTDHFRGLYMKGRVSFSLLEECLQELPEGTTELMVHPGRLLAEPSFTPFSGFATADRERELEALLSPCFRQSFEKAGVVLTSFLEGP